MSEPDEITNDIGTALMKVREAFMKHGISPPDILEYSSIDKGYKSAIVLRNALGPTNWVMDFEAKPYNEMCLAGFTLRFEAKHIDRGSGSELDDGILHRQIWEHFNERDRNRYN